MNDFHPLALRDSNGNPTGKWTFCVDDGSGARIVGRCAANLCWHTSADEARGCFQEWLLAEHAAFDAARSSVESPCEFPACGSKTRWVTTIGGTPSFFLCESHRNIESLRSLVKFSDGAQPISPGGPITIPTQAPD